VKNTEKLKAINKKRKAVGICLTEFGQLKAKQQSGKVNLLVRLRKKNN